MRTLWLDLIFALRRLRTSVGFTLVAVVTLALTIGASTAIFSVVNAVLVRPLPYAEPERLMVIRHTTPDPELPEVPLSYPNFLDLQKEVRSLSAMAAAAPRPYLLTGDGPPDQLQGAKVTSLYFSVFGVEPLLGRTFRAEEDVPGSPRVAVLSNELWQSRFGGDAAVVGSSIELDGQPHEVVGVMPETWSVRLENSQLWSPLALDPEALERDTRFLQTYGRLAPEVTPERAEAELNAVMAGLVREHPEANRGLGIKLLNRRDLVLGDISKLLYLFTTAVALVLLIGCVNLANLFLARSVARRQEMAVRSAVGAGRWRIVRTVFAECLVLALVGGLLGLLLTFGAVRLLAAFDPGTVPRSDEISVDLNVLLFALSVSLLASVLFGLVPALFSARPDVNRTLRGDGGSGGLDRAEGRFQGLLVIGQVMLTVVLLVGAGLLLRSFAGLLAVDPGFDASRVLTFRLNPHPAKFAEPPAMLAFYRELTEGLRTVPGAEAAGAAAFLPFTDWATGAFRVEGVPFPEGRQPMAERNAVTPGYFAAMGIELLDGRGFTAADELEAPIVVVVNQTLRRRYFGDSPAVGRRLRMGPESEEGTLVTIVGVVEDVRQQGLDVAVEPKIYNAHAQSPWAAQMAVLVRAASGDPLALAPAVRRSVMELDPTLPVVDVRTMEERVVDSIRGKRFVTLLLAIFGVLALVLTSVGIAGVVAYGVNRRHREIGVRLSLGASHAQILRSIVGRQSRRLLVGLVLGLAAALAAGRLIATWLYRVSPSDSWTLALVALVLMATGLLASYLPSRRALKVDPARTLRES